MSDKFQTDTVIIYALKVNYMTNKCLHSIVLNNYFFLIIDFLNLIWK